MSLVSLEAVITVGKMLDGFAVFLSVSDANGHPVAGLTQNEFSIDTLAGSVNISQAVTHFLEPKPGFYILTVMAATPLEVNSAHVVSVVVVHPTPAGGTDNGQTLATVRV